MDDRSRYGQLPEIARGFVDGQPRQSHPEHIVDNITLYWLTSTGLAARSYWEEGQENVAAGQAPTPVSIPVGFDVPGEIWRTPRAGSKAYLRHLLQRGGQGGHFAAWEEPLFSEELRAAFQSAALADTRN